MEKIIILILVLVIISIFAVVRSKKKVIPRQQPTALKGTAIVITGAAARIPQETALLERMYNSGMMEDVVFIAGASSGALNTVILNAILDKKLTWGIYKEMLFTLRNKDIYKLTWKKTTIIVAHRLSTLKNADKILLIEDGKLKEFDYRTKLEQDENSIYYKLLRTGIEEVLS